jgi:hypothetical protein
MNVEIAHDDSNSGEEKHYSPYLTAYAREIGAGEMTVYRRLDYMGREWIRGEKLDWFAEQIVDTASRDDEHDLMIVRQIARLFRDRRL